MKCPYCLVSFFVKWFYILFVSNTDWIQDKDGVWGMRFCMCPACKKTIIQLGKLGGKYVEPSSDFKTKPSNAPGYYDWKLVKPKTISRTPLPSDVPPEFANDYKEACLIIADSPKASAALSRRCLQNILREKAGTTKKDLFDQIQEVIDSEKLPSYLSEDLDAVRNIGNFAAHPIKSKRKGTRKSA